MGQSYSCSGLVIGRGPGFPRVDTVFRSRAKILADSKGLGFLLAVVTFFKNPFEHREDDTEQLTGFCQVVTFCLDLLKKNAILPSKDSPRKYIYT